MRAFAPVSLKEKSGSSVQVDQKNPALTEYKGYEAKTTYPLPVVQRKENNTGLPDNLKSGIESLSGIAMDDVNVHYNSSKPVGLNALAYAQGSNIHVAPGQEKHLSHEAWHVVQQKQGRVQPTMQMKNNVSVNDDKELEKEADEMGNKAIGIREKMPKERTTGEQPARQVVQRRLPQMNEDDIKALFISHPKMAIELLLHAIDNLSDKEIEVIYSKLGGSGFSMADFKNYIKSIDNADEFYFKYKLLNDSVDAYKKYRSTIDQPDLQSTFPNKAKIINKMQALSVKIGQLIYHLKQRHPRLLPVFGIERNDLDRIGHVRTVYASIKSQIDTSVRTKKLPFVIITEEDHNVWAGIGATAPRGNEPITLPQIVITEFIGDSLVHTGLLVHELSHKATPKTYDVSDYDLDSIKYLTPDQRIINAESYALGYLEIFGPSDPARYYDPSLFKTTAAKSGGGLTSSRDIISSNIKGFFQKLWARLNDAYKYDKKVYNQVMAKAPLSDIDKSADFQNLQAAIFPHGTAIPSEFDTIRALLEDRSRAVKYFINTPGYINRVLRDELSAVDKISPDKLDVKAQLKDMIPRLLQVPFNFSLKEAGDFVGYWVDAFGI